MCRIAPPGDALAGSFSPRSPLACRSASRTKTRPLLPSLPASPSALSLLPSRIRGDGSKKWGRLAAFPVFIQFVLNVLSLAQLLRIACKPRATYLAISFHVDTTDPLRRGFDINPVLIGMSTTPQCITLVGARCFCARRIQGADCSFKYRNAWRFQSSHRNCS